LPLSASRALGDRTQLGGTAFDRLRILTNCRTLAMVGLSMSSTSSMPIETRIMSAPIPQAASSSSVSC
jgi:hypothetical protein